ncbi:hypothetical protein [Dankookia sp. P2]|uniref:hypothetical protein n=1 Tax=Dankookia sp. P2 TaxID=3423955 RepID=UPI003D67744A
MATLRYSYDIRADSAAILLQVTLRAAPGILLSHVRLTTACDALSDIPRACHVGTEGTYATPKLPPAGAAYLHRGPLQQILLTEAGNPGFAHTLYLRPRRPDHVASLSATTLADGRLQWVVLRHAAPRIPAGGEFAIAEDRLLLAGGDLAQAPMVGRLLDLAGGAGRHRPECQLRPRRRVERYRHLLAARHGGQLRDAGSAGSPGSAAGMVRPAPRRLPSPPSRRKAVRLATASMSAV